MTGTLRDFARLIPALALPLGLSACSLVVDFDRNMVGPVCGDGLVEGTEACDDGNADGGDGCDEGCAVESGFTCYGPAMSGCLELPSGTLSGIQGFSTSDFYGQPAADALRGSDSMTRSILFRLDTTGTQQTLFEHVVAGDGWAFVITDSGLLQWRLYSGGDLSVLGSARLSAGTIYAATGSFDGTTQRLVINTTAVPSQAASFTAPGDASVANIGLAFGANPASGTTILGLAASDSVALTDAQAQAHNEASIASGSMEAFDSVEHRWVAPDLETDAEGDLDWSVTGSLSAVDVD